MEISTDQDRLLVPKINSKLQELQFYYNLLTLGLDVHDIPHLINQVFQIECRNVLTKRTGLDLSQVKKVVN